jgi:hypothetical protein
MDSILIQKNVHLNSSEIFVATSLEDNPSRVTFRSTPRSVIFSGYDRWQEFVHDEPNRAKARAGVP